LRNRRAGSATNKRMESRVVDLEIRYAHLEKQLAELNQVVFEQSKSIAQMQAQLVALRTRVTGLGEPMENEKPPHY
jgi:uncharacterized coiled-coil protein SlyX